MAVPCAWRVREKEEEDDWEAAADKDEDDWESSVAEFKTLTVKADGEEPVSMKRAEFFRCMRLRYAVTYASAQGLTIRTLLALHDTGHKYFDWRKLYVGLSRATAVDRVIVY